MKRILSLLLCMAMLVGMMSSLAVTSSAAPSPTDTYTISNPGFYISATDNNGYTHLAGVTDNQDITFSMAYYFGCSNGGSTTSRLMIGSQAGIQMGYDLDNKKFFIGNNLTLFDGGAFVYQSNTKTLDFTVPEWKGNDSAYDGYGNGWIVIGFRYHSTGAAILVNGIEVLSASYSDFDGLNNPTGGWIIFYPHNITVYCDNYRLYNGSTLIESEDAWTGTTNLPDNDILEPADSPITCSFHLWQGAVTLVHRYNNDDIVYNSSTGSYLNSLLNAYNSMSSSAQTEAAANGHKIVLDQAFEYYNAIGNAINSINAIGTVSYPGSGTAITNARSAYSAVPSHITNKVTNYSTLEAAETLYAQLKAEAEAAAANQAAADAVIAKINAIGTVTLNSGTAISEAETAYNNLTQAQKDLVGNYSTLTAARATYDTLVANQAAADAAVAKINAIGTVTYTSDCKAKIDAASTAYYALTDAQLALVPDATQAAFASAVSVYSTLENEVNAFVSAVAALPSPAAATDACLSAINTADTAYAALTDAGQISAVSAQKAALEAYREAYNTAVSDKAAVDNVISKIDNIGDVASYPTLALAKSYIDDARNAYDALASDSLREQVTNYQDLLDAEATYAALKKEADDKAAAQVVIDAINAIGDVTLDDAAAIAAARDAFTALTADQQALVDNISTLDAAEVTLAALQTAKSEAEAVEALINAIGTVTLDSKADIVAAEQAYANLSDTAKDYVTNHDTLTAARDTYTDIVTATVNQFITDAKAECEDVSLANKADINDLINTYNNTISSILEDLPSSSINAKMQAQTYYSNLVSASDQIDSMEFDIANVEYLIDEIGEVTLQSGSDIQVAELAYNSLSDVNKTYVENYEDLVEARRIYNALVIDDNIAKEAAAAFDAQVEAIGEVTSQSGEAIDAAYAAYEQLSDAAKDYVTTKDALDQKKADYDALVEANNAAADAVDALIDAIGTVTLEAGDAAIVEAEEAYAALTADQQALVEDYADLVAARETYDALVAADNIAKEAAAAFDAQVEEIGEVTSQSGEAIDDAYAAYEQLSDAAKGYVTTKDALDQKKADYDALVAANNAAADAVDALIDAIGTVTLEAGDAAIVEAEEAYAALTADQQALVDGYDDLVAARETYDALVAADNIAKEAAAAFDAQVEAIGEVTSQSGEAIDDAYAAYEQLSDAAKDYVTTKDALDQKKADYDALVEANNAAADAVDALIDAIGTVTLDSKAAIVEAEEAFAALTADQQALVDGYDDLVAARETYDALVVAEVQAFNTAAKNELQDVSISNKSDISDLIAEYDGTIYYILNDLPAENDIDKISAEGYRTSLQTAYDKIVTYEEDVRAVINLIYAIGDVTLDSEAAIVAAEEAYAALSDDSKTYVENAGDLEKARADYDALVDAANNAAADEVDALIDAIGDVTLDSKAAIVEAEEAYAALTADQQALVDGYDDLVAAREAYTVLVVAEVKEFLATADEELADITLANQFDIGMAISKYETVIIDILDDLPEENFADKHNAPVKYQDLLNAYDVVLGYREEVINVMNLIYAIGDVTLDSEAAIVAAEEAYAALSDDNKIHVQNAGDLVKARETYDALVAEEEAKNAASAANTIKATSLVISDSLAINYKIGVDSAYTIVGVEFTLADTTTLVTDYTVDANGRYVFRYDNIAPHLMGETIYSVIIVKDANGNEIKCNAQEYSIAAYANKKIATEALTELLASLVNYGDAAVSYTGMFTAPSGLINNWELYADSVAPVRGYTSIEAIGNEIAAPTVTWGSANLILSDSVDICLKLSGTISDGYYAIGVYNGDEYRFNVEYNENDGYYFCRWDLFNAAQMSNDCVIVLTIYDADGNAVSNSLTYSVESYVSGIAGVDANLDALLTAMMQYGDAAFAYKTATNA